jgi:hypothetical protein
MAGTGKSRVSVMNVIKAVVVLEKQQSEERNESKCLLLDVHWL